MITIFEGPDGSGKTTLAKAVSEAWGVECLRCPGGTPSGEKIREMVLGKEKLNPVTRALLFAAADYETMALAAARNRAGQDVVMDRCGLSGLAYRMQASELYPVNRSFADALSVTTRLSPFVLLPAVPPGELLVIYTTCPDDVRRERIDSRQAADSAYDLESFQGLARIYEAVMRDIEAGVHPHFCRLDTSNSSVADLVERVTSLKAEMSQAPKYMQ